MSCPDDNALAALSEGRLPAAEAQHLRTHLEGCDDCRQALALAAGTEDQLPSERLRRGESVGRYVVLGLVGTGSMGEVYAAFDPELDRRVALKLLRAGLREDGAERLLAEAKAMARLAHPNVVVVHDAGQLDGRVFLAMEWVQGQTLQDWLTTPRRLGETLAVFCGLGDGLEAAHRAGVVHRDFKPANALIGQDGRPRVADFGLAQTAPGKPELAGTLHFLAPEVLAGRPADARSDQFSFCAALAQALARQTVPRWLEKVLARGSAVEPSARFPSMHALVVELRRDRLKVARRALLAAVPLALLATGVGARAVTQAQRCHQGAQRVAQVWSPAAKAQLVAAFQATGLPYAAAAAASVGEALDTWAAGWARAVDGTCAARGSTSEAVTARETLCLEARLDEARALVALFGSADTDTVAHAADAARNLSAPETCAAVGRQHPKVDDATLAAAMGKAAQAKVWFDAGLQARALAMAREAAVAAGPLGSAALTAQTHLVLGLTLAREGDDPAARSAFFEAAVAAEESGEAALAMRAWGHLAVLVAEREPSAHVGESWGRLARAALERAAGGPLLEAELDDFLLSVARAEARTDDALALAQAVLTLRQQALGPQHPLVGQALLRQAMALHGVGRTAEAPALLERARTLMEAAYGLRHPEVAQVMRGQGLVALRLWKLTEAKQRYTEALEVNQASTSAGPLLASAFDNLGHVETLLGETAVARQHLERALALKQALPRADHPSLAGTLLSLAALDLDVGEKEASPARARQALAMLEPLLGSTHPALLNPLVAVGAACRALGQWPCAEQMLARMRAMAQANHSSSAVVLREEGELLLARGRAPEAAAAFRQSATAGQGWEEHLRLGRALEASAQWPAAEAELNAALEALARLDHPQARAQACRLWAQARARQQRPASCPPAAQRP